VPEQVRGGVLDGLNTGCSSWDSTATKSGGRAADLTFLAAYTFSKALDDASAFGDLMNFTNYKRSYDVRIRGGVGDANIYVPSNVGVIAYVKGDLGRSAIPVLRSAATLT
jgi:hypothetical protein